MPQSWLPVLRVAVVLMVVVEHNPSLRWCISYTTCARSPFYVPGVVSAKAQKFPPEKGARMEQTLGD